MHTFVDQLMFISNIQNTVKPLYNNICFVPEMCFCNGVSNIL